MKKIIVVILVLLSAYHSEAKIGIEIGLNAGMRMQRYFPFGDTKAIFPVGGKIYLQVNRWVTFDYSFSSANYGKGKFNYVHSPALFAIGNYYVQQGRIYGVLFALLPEGFGYYLREDHSGFHIALDVAGIDYYHEKGGWRDTFDPVFSTIVRYRFTRENRKMAITPFVGFSFPWYVSASVQAGLQLSVEKKK